MNRLDNFSKYLELRKAFPFLSYDLYRYHYSGNSFEMEFLFNLAGKFWFSPHISIPLNRNLIRQTHQLSDAALDNLVFHIGMIEMISYWKAACPQEVRIIPHSLSTEQVSFWKKIYFQGLGEFFYLNSINSDEEDFMHISAESDKPVAKFRIQKEDGSIIPVGGGKDSAVTMGLLNRNGMHWTPLSINPTLAALDVIDAAGKKAEETIIIQREIHPKLLELNQMGFLNGHTPFSALLGFYSLLVASLSGKTDIILSNEASANEATVPGTKINHQYSKSIEYENDFRTYTREFISEDLNYFSLLRPLSELQIGGLFSYMDEFHQSFRSCNVGSKENKWCGHCPKCLFTFIILSPFIEPEKLSNLFGKNLLEDESLTRIMEQLDGSQEIKPFECIGTIDEVNIALDQAVEKYRDKKMPLLLESHLAKRRTSSSDLLFKEMMKKTETGHFVPAIYKNLLMSAL